LAEPPGTQASKGLGETSALPAAQPAPTVSLVRAEDVVKHFPARLGASVKAVDGVSFEIRRGECLGLVGESGCGKSTLGRLVTQLLPLTSGRIWFKDVDLSRLRGEKLRLQRREFQMIFQDPYASLDPRMTVGDIIAEPLDNFRVARGRARNDRVQELLHTVGLNPNFNNRYPHEFSGGQRQRIGIARALSMQPSLIVCDEAVSALDVSIQGQIINLLQDLQRQFDLTYLFIAHDLAVVRHISDRVMVMYLGKIVEVAESTSIYTDPRHPYSAALLSAIPVPDPKVERRRKLVHLEGEIPSPLNPPTGCRFHTRCPIARVPGVCSEVEPPMEERTPGHWSACHFSDEVGSVAPWARSASAT
jgi:oligopeptide transport system ATP-binding protein